MSRLGDFAIECEEAGLDPAAELYGHICLRLTDESGKFHTNACSVPVPTARLAAGPYRLVSQAKTTLSRALTQPVAAFKGVVSTSRLRRATPPPFALSLGTGRNAMPYARKPRIEPQHSHQDEKWAWAFLAIVSAVMLIEIGFPLVLDWLLPVGGR